SQRDELEWFLRQPDGPTQEASATEFGRWRDARRPFRGARFAALRRSWIAEGSRSIYLAASPISRDTIPRGRGRVECVTIPLESSTGISCRSPVVASDGRRNEGG